MKAIILAAGIGVRLNSITKNLPKAFIPIDGKPLIEHSLDNLKNAGIKEVIFIIGYKKRTI
ncbi:NTP transferase domain-containing protein [archaeon AH-315-M20]|nr:NTP transferase domain-containing protein [archaeon AH-315-M20]